METKDFTTSILVDKSREEVYNAVNNVRGWWSEQIDGQTHVLGETFNYRHKEAHLCKIKVVELVPKERVVWLVLENYFNFTEDKNEWQNTKIIFEISEINGTTQLQFTHVGLTPAYECYKICFDAWTNYITVSLRNLITTGTGKPNPKEGDSFNAELLRKWNLPE
ncbi:MAG: SRPBCC domain-containing protein [Chitinophagaceae bacterium]|nr:SRPBCC domain-containing protein [Chitinophagaceae bacterium]